MSNIIIEEFEREKDIENYADLKSHFLSDIWSEEYREHFIDTFKLNSDNKLFLVFLGEKLIGHIFLKFINNEIYIEEIDFLEEHRRKGYGRSLISFVIERFKKNLFLLVDKENGNAIAFYEKLGFKEVENNKTTIKMKKEVLV